MVGPNQRWLGRPQSKGGKSKVRTGALLAVIYTLRVLDLLTQCIAFEKAAKNGFLVPLVTSLNNNGNIIFWFFFF